MSLQDLENYDYKTLREVGKVSHEALQHSKNIVKEGRKILDIAEDLEKFIKGKGFEMAFPINISINEKAAHYTPVKDDPYILSGSETIKIDLGARKGEYLGDCAITIDLSQKYSKLVEASEEALNSAISMVKSGREVREIGKEIEKIAEAKGFKPIKNLGGHGIDKTDLHASVFIPNYDNGDATKLEEGQVIAIEPFITDGFGMVTDGETIDIFQKTKRAALRSPESREISDFIDKNYVTYPFAMRWLQSAFPNFTEFKIKRALNELAAQEAIETFPVLVEKKNGTVSQSEKELIVEKDSCEIVTK